MSLPAEETALVSVSASRPSALAIVTPLVDPVQAQEAVAQYEALKKAIVRPDDIQAIQGRKFLKKSFWRRVATCFGLSLELVSEARELDAEGRLAYSAIYRAIAPNGRSMTGDGYCCRSEKGRNDWPEHNVRATAHTRAKNRAISDLVGGGEVSAEEIVEDDEDDVEEWEGQHQRARSLGATESQWEALRKGRTLRQVTHLLDNKERQLTGQRKDNDQATPPAAATIVESTPAQPAPAQPAPRQAQARLPEDVRKAVLHNTGLRSRLKALGYESNPDVETFLRWCAEQGATSEDDVRALIIQLEDRRDEEAAEAAQDEHALEGLPAGGMH